MRAMQHVRCMRSARETWRALLCAVRRAARRVSHRAIGRGATLLRTRRALAHDECGQSSVEAAFALPVLLLLALMLVQPGIVLYDRIVMKGAAAEGCRLLATSKSASASENEDYIRRHLGAVPQHDLFHVHGDACTWNIQLTGDETSEQVSVTIATEVKPLALTGSLATFLGMTNDRGNLVVEVTSTLQTQPAWVAQSELGLNPQTWIGAWT